MHFKKTSLYFQEEAALALAEYLINCQTANRRVFWLVDEHTLELCLPVLAEQVDTKANAFRYHLVPSGEKNKNITQVLEIFNFLTQMGADRHSVLVVLGGGMLCDLGGFAASVYQRGIESWYIPTSLLAMVDAAIGGKTGFNFNDLKNQIGSFYSPTKVFIINKFLKTLPKRELFAGFAEVIKYGFISNIDILGLLPQVEKPEAVDQKLIRFCVDEKLRITESDYYESGIRKWLNFGHTVGHAIESCALQKGIDVLHGEAVAVGIMCALWLSTKKMRLDDIYLIEYQRLYNCFFEQISWIDHESEAIYSLMKADKKNAYGKINFVLLSGIGQVMTDVVVEKQLVFESFHFYASVFDAK